MSSWSEAKGAEVIGWRSSGGAKPTFPHSVDEILMMLMAA